MAIVKPGGKADPKGFKLFTKYLKKEIKDKIYDPSIYPVEWKSEGIERPNRDTKQIAYKLCCHILSIFGVTPRRISATIEEGMFIQYTNDSLTDIFEIEIYNDDLSILYDYSTSCHHYAVASSTDFKTYEDFLDSIDHAFYSLCTDEVLF